MTPTQTPLRILYPLHQTLGFQFNTVVIVVVIIILKDTKEEKAKEAG